MAMLCRGGGPGHYLAKRKEDAMNETLSSEDRRHVRASLLAGLAAMLTIALGSFAWAEVNPAAAERTSTISAPAAAPANASPAVDAQEAAVGCGCAEGCRG